MTHEQMISAAWFDKSQLDAIRVAYSGDKTTSGRASGGYGMNILDSFRGDPDERTKVACALAHARWASHTSPCPACGREM